MKRIVTTLPAAAVAASFCLLVAPAAPAQSRGETILWAGYEDSGIHVIRPKDGAEIGVAKTGLLNGRTLVWNPVRKELYVLADNGAEIAVVDPVRNAETAKITESVGWNGHSVALSPDGDTLYAVFSSGSNDPDLSPLRVVAYDLATRRAAKIVRLKDAAGRATCVLSRDGSRLYVLWEGKLDVYDAKSMERLERTESGDLAGAGHLVAGVGQWLFAATPDSLVRIDVTKSAVDATFPLSQAPYFMTSSEAGRRLFLGMSGYVLEIGNDLSEPRQYQEPGMVQSASESEDGHTLYVSTQLRDNSFELSAVDTRTRERRVLATSKTAKIGVLTLHAPN